MEFADYGDLRPHHVAAAEAFLLDLQLARRQPGTIMDHRRHLNEAIAFFAEHDLPDLPELTADHLRQFLHYLSLRPRWHGHRLAGDPQLLSEEYLDTLHRRMKTFFKFCVREGRIGQNPFDRIRRVQPPKKLVPLVPEDLFLQIMESIVPEKFTTPAYHFRAIRNTAVFWILRDTPARSHELFSLTMDRVQPEYRRLHVTGKGRRERYMYLGNAALRALRRYLDARRAINPRTDRLWVGPDSKPLGNRMWIYWMVKRLGDKLGDPDLHPHRFRHTYVIDLVRAGVPIPVIEVMGGWSRIPHTYLAMLGDEVAREFQTYFSPGDRLAGRIGPVGLGPSHFREVSWGKEWPPVKAPVFLPGGRYLGPDDPPLPSGVIIPDAPQTGSPGALALPPGAGDTQEELVAFARGLYGLLSQLDAASGGGSPGREMPPAFMMLMGLLADYSKRGDRSGSNPFQNG